MQQRVGPLASRALNADTHEPIANGQFFVDGLSIYLKHQTMVAVRAGLDVPANLTFARHANRADRDPHRVVREKAHVGPSRIRDRKSAVEGKSVDLGGR